MSMRRSPAKRHACKPAARLLLAAGLLSVWNAAESDCDVAHDWHEDEFLDSGMKLKRSGLSKLMVEPAAVATGDIAFNLVIFFLVCAASADDKGRKQVIPSSQNQTQQAEQTRNLEVTIDRNGIAINAKRIPINDFASRIKRDLQGRTRPEDKIVVVKSDKNTPYQTWITVTGQIEEAGGITTLQIEEEKQVFVK